VQVDVEHEKVDVFLLECGARSVERVSLEHLVPVELEVDPAEQADRGIVVDDEDSGRRMTPFAPHLGTESNGDRRLLRIRAPEAAVSNFEMAKDFPQPERGGCGVQSVDPACLPHPTNRFRHRSWLAFQRALDPLAPPRPLPAEAATRRRRPPPVGG
jgi:hypothetical protein